MEIARINMRSDGPNGYVYELRARADGFYPNVRGGLTYLKKDEVWKIGQTTRGFLRYNNKRLETTGPGVYMQPIPPGGTQKEILIQEKMMIYNYYIKTGHLPPGNKIFR